MKQQNEDERQSLTNVSEKKNGVSKDVFSIDTAITVYSLGNLFGFQKQK